MTLDTMGFGEKLGLKEDYNSLLCMGVAQCYPRKIKK